jgi:hypothetical protein
MSRDDTDLARIEVLAPRETGAADAPAGVDARSPRRRRRRWVIGAAVVAVVALVAYGPWRGEADVRDGTSPVSGQEMAARHGIDVTLIAVTAAGGLVELRLQVTDPDKADAILYDESVRPVIVSEDTGATLVMSTPPHHHGELQLGGSYFFLLANAHNAIAVGSDVTLVVGDSRLEHLDVQG